MNSIGDVFNKVANSEKASTYTKFFHCKTSVGKTNVATTTGLAFVAKWFYGPRKYTPKTLTIILS